MQSNIPNVVFDIFVAATAAGVLIQAGILVGMFIALRKTQKKVEGFMDEARVHLMPAIAKSRSLIDDIGPKVTSIVEDLTPKIKIISSNIVETTSMVRREAENIKGAVDEVVGRTKGQAARVDGIVSGTLDGVEHATNTIQRGVQIPIRKISAWVAGIKAGAEVLGRKRTTTAKPFGSDYAYPATSSFNGDLDTSFPVVEPHLDGDKTY